MKRTIIIMAEVPSAIPVNTRLEAALNAEQSAAFSECLLADAIHKAKTFESDLIIAYSPSGKAEYFGRFAVENSILTAQRGENLGERMLHAFEFAFARKSDPVVMLSPDSPTFPFDYIEQAFEYLELNTDAVLGKTEKGGIYLIGLRKLNAVIFETVTTSSPQTFEKIFHNLHRLNWHFREVPSWYDVSDEKDFRQLCEEFLHNENARRRAPQTFAWLKQNYML